MAEFLLTVPVEVAAGELKVFYHQNGGSRLLPKIERDDSESDIVRYFLRDGEASSSILFRPAEGRGSVLTVNTNDSNIWGARLDDPKRSILNESAFVGSVTSPKCADFCNEFIDYLESTGIISIHTNIRKTEVRKGGRPRLPENIWAKQQIDELGRNKGEVFKEWLEMRGAAGRQESDTIKLAQDAFRKAIK